MLLLTKLAFSLWEQYSATSCGLLDTTSWYVITGTFKQLISSNLTKNKTYANLMLNTSQKVIKLLLITFPCIVSLIF